jgi:hypothetical protein
VYFCLLLLRLKRKLIRKGAVGGYWRVRHSGALGRGAIRKQGGGMQLKEVSTDLCKVYMGISRGNEAQLHTKQRLLGAYLVGRFDSGSRDVTP